MNPSLPLAAADPSGMQENPKQPPAEDSYAEKGKSTYPPAIIAAGTALFMLGIAVYLPLVIASLVIVVLAIVNLFKADIQENSRNLKKKKTRNIHWRK